MYTHRLPMESDSDTRSKQQLLVLPAKAVELISLFLSLLWWQRKEINTDKKKEERNKQANVD